LYHGLVPCTAVLYCSFVLCGCVGFVELQVQQDDQQVAVFTQQVLLCQDKAVQDGNQSNGLYWQTETFILAVILSDSMYKTCRVINPSVNHSFNFWKLRHTIHTADIQSQSMRWQHGMQPCINSCTQIYATTTNSVIATKQ